MMKKNTKRAMIRASKFFHMAMTILLFFACLDTFYQKHGTGLIFIAVYCLLTLFFMRTYSAYQLGMARINMLVYSQTLANTVTAAVTYALMVLEQMEFVPLYPILGLVAIQFVWNCVWSFLANTLYFSMYPAKKTVILYRTQEDLLHLEELQQYTRKYQVEKVVSIAEVDSLDAVLSGAEVVFVTGIEETMRNRIQEYCVAHDSSCYVMPHIGDVLMMGSTHMELFSVPLFRITRAAPNIEYAAVKRGLDILGSSIGLILASPLMLIAAIAIKLYDGGPVIYKQVRLTRDRKEFSIYKFRSMRVDAERDGVARLASENDDRITPIGKIIRACRIDELPQLFNILRGDMSIVGPRPERPEIAAQYEEQMPAFALRLQVKAGLTGFAQVYGKYNTDPANKLRMDLMYISRMSLLEDIKLIFATVKILFMKESTSGVAKGQTTAQMSERIRNTP